MIQYLLVGLVDPQMSREGSIMRHAEDLCSVSFRDQARSGVLGIRYLGPFYFRYMVFFGQNSGIKYLVFPEF